MIQLVVAIACMYAMVVVVGLWARNKSKMNGATDGRIVRRTSR